MGIHWNGTDKGMVDRIGKYGDAVQAAIRKVADYFAPIIESYAKQQAPWTDRTANARQALHAYVEEEAQKAVRLYLSHGMEYGIYLETKNPTRTITLGDMETIEAGKYAIILPTLDTHYPEVMQMVQEVLR